MRSINQDGLDLIKSFEGLRFTAYKDPGGLYTCGYGHTSGVGPESTCTEALADSWLSEDLLITENVVAHLVTIPLNDNQYAALVSFCFNVGAGDFKKSTVLSLLNAGRTESAAQFLLRYDKIAGVPNEGIARRRAAEMALFFKPVGSSSP